MPFNMLSMSSHNIKQLYYKIIFLYYGILGQQNKTASLLVKVISLQITETNFSLKQEMYWEGFGELTELMGGLEKSGVEADSNQGILKGLGRCGSQKQELISGLLRYHHWNY